MKNLKMFGKPRPIKLSRDNKALVKTAVKAVAIGAGIGFGLGAIKKITGD